MNLPVLSKVIAPISATALLIISIAWMAGLFSEKVAPNEVNTQQQTATLEQNSWQVSTTSVNKIESAPASLKARETTLISSRILARIEQIHVRAGDQVTQGMPLITLENSNLLSQLAQSKSRLDALQGSMHEAKNALERVQNLKQKGLTSNAELDQAQATFTRLSGEVQAAIQGQKEAEAALSYSNIVAPISGKIVDRKAEPGNMATPGQPLLALYNPKTLLIEANVRETVATRIRIGQQVNAYIESISIHIPAIISELVPAADPNAHSFIVKADISFNEQLHPGMFARLSIPIDEENLILVPRDWVQSFGQLDRVWVVKNNQLSRRFIRVGEIIGDKIEVVSGLKPGEVISQPLR